MARNVNIEPCVAALIRTLEAQLDEGCYDRDELLGAFYDKAYPPIESRVKFVTTGQDPTSGKPIREYRRVPVDPPKRVGWSTRAINRVKHLLDNPKG